MTEVVTSEEFWAQHATQYTKAQNAQVQEIGRIIMNLKDSFNLWNGLYF